MDYLSKHDRQFRLFCQKRKNTEDLVGDYIKHLERHTTPRQISWGKVSHCYRLTPEIIKKKYLLPENRMEWELRALRRLESYQHFPKILYFDDDKNILYMTNVGDSLKHTRNRLLLPKNIISQARDIVKSLKAEEIFHRDLGLEHFRLRNGILYLIDFEKCFLSNADYENNRAKNTSMWQKLRYHDMDHIETMIQNYCDSIDGGLMVGARRPLLKTEKKKRLF